MTKARILIVENESIIATDIQNTLKSLGYDAPAIAFSGEQAIKKTEEIKPDLVLMNIILKGEMDGIEAAAEIRNRCTIPILYLTGYMDEERLKRAKTTEPFGYILKPFEERELQTAIETTLSKFKT